MTIKTIIAWDLGATKCAAALLDYHTETKALTCKRHINVKIRSCESLDALVSTLETALELTLSAADAICIGAAGQYKNGVVELEEGYPYRMDFARLAKEQHWPPFAILHDYSPIVCGTFTPYIDDPQHVNRLNHAAINPEGRRVALGIGTGIGLKDGILLEDGNFWLGTNEMGHIGVITPPLTEDVFVKRHQALMHFFRSEALLAENEALTFEKLLANQGMARMHAFFDRGAKHKTAEEIGDLVRDGKANETLAAFAWYTGLLVGTVQLSFMPDGGIWLSGGVVLNHPEVFSHPDFFRGIHASPAYLNLREQFPLGILCGKAHAFMGCGYYASKRLLPCGD